MAESTKGVGISMTGDKLQEIRGNAGMTQEAFARVLGVSVYTIVRNEQRKEISSKLSEKVENWQQSKPTS